MDYIIELMNWIGLPELLSTLGSELLSFSDVFIDQISD